MYTTKSQDYYKSIPSAQSIIRILVIIYIALFIFVHAFILYQYMSGGAEKRNVNKDIAIMVAFFLFPYLAYLLEQYLYFAIVYIDAMIYGKVYKYEFNDMLYPVSE